MLIASRVPPVCDFCSDPHITKDYKCRSFESPAVGWGSLGDWAACAQCAALIDAEKWEELVDRALTTYQYSYLNDQEKAVMRPVLLKLHQEFNRRRIKEATA